MSCARIGAAAIAALVLLGSACSKSGRPAEKGPSPSADAGSSSASRKASAAAKPPAEVTLCQHGVPADQCTKCNPALTDAFKDLDDWCDLHGLPKSHCLECNPKLTFAPVVLKDWCREHALPESMCTKCNPALVARFIGAGDYCREHGYPASVCPIHHPELVKAAGAEPPVFPAPGTLIRLASAETAEDAGIETVRIEARPFGRSLEVVGQLEFNQNRLAQLSARGEALIVDVRVDVGENVRTGQSLATLTSAAVGSNQSQLLAAEARVRTARLSVEREAGLVRKGITARRDLEVAQADLAAAEGDYDAAKAGLGAAGVHPGGKGGRYVLSAPFAGTVVSRDAVIGKSATPGQLLFEVADLTTMWAQLDIPEAEASLVRAGQSVVLTFEGSGVPSRAATITRVGASVDAATRTVKARIELPNQDRVLKAGTFVRARIQIAQPKESLMVPRGAIQRAEGHTLVFVRKEPGVYEPVVVELGASAREAVEVRKGLAPGAEVVTTGAFLLKTELLKDSIGAGCCEEGEAK